MTSRDRKLAGVLAANGISNSTPAVQAFRQVKGIAISVCAAMLEAESWGHNEFGADPGGTALPRAWFDEPVTKARYETYSHNVDVLRLAPNGVGPCQLTYRPLQLAADELGGCWVPLHNMVVGFDNLKNTIAQAGSIQEGFARYNGSGPAAEAYGERAVVYERDWHARFVRAGLAT